MKEKRIIKLTIILIVIGLMITLSATSTHEKTEEKQLPAIEWKEYKQITFSSKATFIDQKAQILENEHQTFSIPLFEGMHPTIATNGPALIMGFDDLELTGSWFSASPDGGQSWSDGGGWDFGSSEYPTIDHLTGNRFIGSMSPDYTTTGTIALCDFEDYTNLDTWVATGWDWEDNGFYDFQGVNFACNDGSMEDWRVGFWTFHGYVGLDYNLQDAPLVQYPTDDNFASISGVELENCIKSASDLDKTEMVHYAIWQRYNDSTDLNDIILRIDNADYNANTGSDGVYADLITGENNENMDICAENDNVIIVSESGSDIICYYSDNGLNSFDIAEIGQGSSPRITETNDGAIVTFVRNGRLYASSTSNGGASWETATEISEGNVYDDYHEADVCEAGVVYTGTDDIVYFEPDIGSSRPIITIGDITGGIGVKVDVNNIGTADATDIAYTISATGGILGMINKEVSDTISISAGDSDTISLPMIIGIGAVTIEVTVDQASETAEGFQILFFTSI